MIYHAESDRVLIVDALLVMTAIIGGFTDARRGKIYNLLTFPVMVMGLAINGGLGGSHAFQSSLEGLAVGILIQIVPFQVGLIKGGDVKFLAAAGALKGPVFVFWGFLYGAALFGAYAIVVLALRGSLKQSMTNISEYLKSWIVLRTETAPSRPASQDYMPWGISLAAGFLVSLILELTIGTPN